MKGFSGAVKNICKNERHYLRNGEISLDMTPVGFLSPGVIQW